MDKVEVLELVANKLLQGELVTAKEIMQTEYPFKKIISIRRNYTDRQKMKQFRKDGFIDRYSGQKLINPGLLKVLSYYMPDVFRITHIGKWKNAIDKSPIYA